MLVISILLSALAFSSPQVMRAGRSRASMMAKSKAIPFLDAPAALDGYIGNKGFDPLNFSSVNMRWMVEAELKHCRLAMLATAGWLAVDLGARFPGAAYAAVPSALAAHDFGVGKGDMLLLLLAVGVVEAASLLATARMLRGETDRQPGDFGFDPLALGGGGAQRLRLSEISNGRLAMLAFSGIVTQSALTGLGFPYY